MGTPSETVVFLHVPKAAGLTLVLQFLELFYAPDEIYHIDAEALKESTAELRGLLTEQKERIKLLYGHFGFGYHELLPQPCRYVTMLRHPVDRVVSSYYYMRRSKEHRNYDALQSMSLPEFVESDMVRNQVFNGQTRLLAGIENPHTPTAAEQRDCTEEDFAVAMTNLSGFTWVGITERFDESVMLLCARMGWRPPFYVRQNARKGRASSRRVDDDLHRKILSMNEFDLHLYNRGLELLEDGLREEGVSLRLKTALYRFANGPCQAGRLVRWRWRRQGQRAQRTEQTGGAAL